MKKYLFLFLAASALTLACSREALNPSEEPTTNYQVQIDPVLTKVTETDFENGDAIGLTVTRQRGAWASNAKLVFDSGMGAFAGDLLWYDEGADEAELFAYYPYVNLESGVPVPGRFNVATDQQSGTSSSDLIFGTKNGVLPSAHAISMEFKHKLSRVVINVTNNAGYTIGGLTLKGSIPSADISDFEVLVNPDLGPADIQMFKASATQYQAIVVPQTVAFEVEINAAGVPMKQKMEEMTLLSGKQYTINMIVNPTNIKVALSGAVANWDNGGVINPDDSEIVFEEHLDEHYFIYHNEYYYTADMKDGRIWMADNLRYVPDGFTPSSDLTAVTAGVFYPLALNADSSEIEFVESADMIASKGYLYQAEVALGLNVGDLTTVAQAEALEGAQGICPPGWHVPTIAEILALVGKSAGQTTVTTAPYYDGANGSIALLNADGFNMDAFGSISIQDNTKTVGTFLGVKYGNRIASGMFCGSSYAGVTYNTSGDETSGIKNLQFYGFMPMTNKATEAEYTCNGTKVSYRIASPLRCVRNEE